MKKFVMGLGLSAVLQWPLVSLPRARTKKAYEKAKQQQVVATEQERLRRRRPLRWKWRLLLPRQQPPRPLTQTWIRFVCRVRMWQWFPEAVWKLIAWFAEVFSLKANAEGLQKTLSNAGYNAQIAYNEAKNMYRVVASTYDDKAAAVQSRNTLRGTYPDAWLLLSKW